MLHFYTPWKHQKTLKFADIFKEYIINVPLEEIGWS